MEDIRNKELAQVIWRLEGIEVGEVKLKLKRWLAFMVGGNRRKEEEGRESCLAAVWQLFGSCDIRWAEQLYYK